MKKLMKVLSIAVVFFFTATAVHAQFQGGPNTGGNSGNPIPPSGGAAVPFDGGLSLILIAAGAGVSAKRKRLTQNV